MPFVQFRDRFPDLAERETRIAKVFENSSYDLPAGDYAFVEMFCDEPGCDCRRVLLSVFVSASREFEATINFGWESRKFYAKWLGDDDDVMLKAMQGPALHLGAAQSEHADAILAMAREAILADLAYVERVKQHYALFRESVEADVVATAASGKKPERNSPCPCGSGRKYKKCCWPN